MRAPGTLLRRQRGDTHQRPLDPGLDPLHTTADRWSSAVAAVRAPGGTAVAAVAGTGRDLEPCRSLPALGVLASHSYTRCAKDTRDVAIGRNYISKFLDMFVRWGLYILGFRRCPPAFENTPAQIRHRSASLSSHRPPYLRAPLPYHAATPHSVRRVRRLASARRLPSPHQHAFKRPNHCIV